MIFRPQTLDGQRVYSVVVHGRCVGLVGRLDEGWWSQEGLNATRHGGHATRRDAGEHIANNQGG